MEASLFSIQLLYTSHTEKETLCQNGGLALFYTAAIYKSYRKGDSLSEWRPLFSIQLLYTTRTGKDTQQNQSHIEKAHSLSEFKFLIFEIEACFKNKKTFRKTNIFQNTSLQKQKHIKNTKHFSDLGKT